LSDRFATGRLNDLYLTDDGAADGIPCRVRVEGQEAFASNYVNSLQTALDFTTHTQFSARGVKSNEFFLILDFCPETLLSSILTLLDAAIASLAPVRVIVSHLETFDVMAMPLTQGQKLFTFESRSGGIAKNVRLRFISTAPGS
jgi:hypothetical protein